MDGWREDTDEEKSEAHRPRLGDYFPLHIPTIETKVQFRTLIQISKIQIADHWSEGHGDNGKEGKR